MSINNNYQSRLIEPLDVLMLRGNKSFGDSGEHGASSMPPSPSVLAGALRSFWLAALDVNFAEYSDRKNPAQPENFAEPIGSQLGTPLHPRGFRLAGSGIARWVDGKLQRIYPLPSDLVIQKEAKDAPTPTVYVLKPTALAEGLLSNLAEGQLVPMLQAPAGKAESGYWLSEAGYFAYIQGKKPQQSDLIKSNELWQSDWRLGIALDSNSRTSSDGQLYTTEACAFKKDVYLVVDIAGAPDFPLTGNLRLGGDGRGAGFSTEKFVQVPQVLAKNGKLKLILTSPAIFAEGWKLPSQDEQGHIYFEGGSARIVTASVPRHQVISGWNLAAWQPKPAERVVPMGSVYWLDDIETDAKKIKDAASLQQALQTLLLTNTDPQRQAEGYNACTLAQWIDD